MKNRKKSIGNSIFDHIFAKNPKILGKLKGEVNETPSSSETKSHSQRSSKESLDVVIGLDFGTSSSKVVIQSENLERAYAVSFGDFGYSTNKYLLPSRPYFDRNGILKMSTSDEGVSFRNLKLDFIDHPQKNIVPEKIEMPARVDELTAAYIGYIIKYSKNWLLSSYQEIFSNYDIYWSVNIGAPSAGYNDQEVRKKLKSILGVGYWISEQNAAITQELVRKALNDSKREGFHPGININDLDVIPEVIAEVIGYSRSQLRENGFHMLIDIGASTMDVVGFNLHDVEGEDKYSIYTSVVERLGGYILHKSRVSNFRERIKVWLDELGKDEDPVKEIPEMVEYLPDFKKLRINDDSIIDSEFSKLCYLSIAKTLDYIKKRRDPRTDRWKSGVPVFLCGGGRDIELYAKVLKEIEEKWKTSGINGIIKKEIEIPNILLTDDDVEVEHHRLAVAYGLSFSSIDIGEINPPDNIEDITEEVRDFYKGIEYISKDHV